MIYCSPRFCLTSGLVVIRKSSRTRLITTPKRSCMLVNGITREGREGDLLPVYSLALPMFVRTSLMLLSRASFTSRHADSKLR